MFILMRANTNFAVFVGAFNIGWWVIDLFHMAFYFFLLVNISACVFFFEGRTAMDLGYASWLPLSNVLNVDMVSPETSIFTKFGVTFWYYLDVATGNDAPAANGLELFLSIAFKVVLNLLFVAYIFGIVIGRLEERNHRRRAMEDIQDKVVEFCYLIGLPDKVSFTSSLPFFPLC